MRSAWHDLKGYLYARCDVIYELGGSGTDAWLMLLIGLLYTLSITHTLLNEMGTEATGLPDTLHCSKGFSFSGSPTGL